mmetsp:Transcript_41645/g.90756  ORF Transcript_41645/g.90756 Transcript_41645/m.90756 type:complete len:962 (+) Transcript_41645:71-2956(+)
MAPSPDGTRPMRPSPSYSAVDGSSPGEGPASALGQQRELGPVRSRFAAAGRLGLVAAVFAGATLAWLGSRGSPAARLRSIPQGHMENKAATWDTSTYKSQCAKVEVDVEYVDEVSGWGMNYDHIPSPEMCCASCQQNPKCKSWTWVKDAGLEGCPSQCWLKGGAPAIDGITAGTDGVTKRPKVGLVSGVPPQAPALGAVPTGVAGPGGSLYCFSLMVPTSDEPKLLAWQYTNKASIFACDEAAIYSNKAIELVPGSGVIAKVVDSDLKCSFGGDSMSALNAWIFIAVWDEVIRDGGYKKHDWVVKVDPDAVFFPDRLGKMLVSHAGEGYISNCKYGLHGPIEVFSVGSMEALAADYHRSWDGKAPKTCVDGMHFGSWGEDMFIDQCLGKMLGEKSTLDSRMICEAHCDCPAYYWCTNGTDRVSFHPFKSVDAYAVCMANAMGLSTPTTYNDGKYNAPYLAYDPNFKAANHTARKVEGEISCKADCHSAYKPGQPCQCNADCMKYKSCCRDYAESCAGGAKPTETEKPLKEAKPEEKGPIGNQNGEGPCFDAVVDGECEDEDPCCVAAKWAKEHGVYEHPEWYPETPATAPYQDFQMSLFKQKKSHCKMPCKKVSGVKASDLAKIEEKFKNTPPGPRAKEFYMYRAQSDSDYPLENINTADLAGVMWYLHNEVVSSTPRKYDVDRIKRFKVTVKNTWEFWNAHKRQFGAFVAYDAGKCTSPLCKDIYKQYGFIVGCQACDPQVANYLAKGQTIWNCELGEDKCRSGLWYSLPGPCPLMGFDNGDIKASGKMDVMKAKSPECIAQNPGGHCSADKVANGAPECTYSYEEAGEIMLDELVDFKALGFSNYNEFWNTSFTRCANAVAQGRLPQGHKCEHHKEYVPHLDKGAGTSFWDGIHDAGKCGARMDKVRSLFKQKFPAFPETLEEPACEFDMYYNGEWNWPINHSNAEPSTSNYWENVMTQ